MANEDSVLLVDDDPGVRKAYGRLLSSRGYQVTTASDGAEAQQLCLAQSFDAVVSDIRLVGISGIEILRRLHETDPELPVILMTGGGDLATAVAAVEHGALRYLLKPIDRQELEKAVAEGVRLRKLSRIKDRALDLAGHKISRSRDPSEMERSFDRALENMFVAFQPIVRWSDRSVVAYEALLRTTEPALRSPVDFIGCAEELGRLFELGRAIRGRVAEMIERAGSGARIFVNLHPLDLADEDLFRTDLPFSSFSEQIVLEITERVSLTKIGDLDDRLSALRNAGFRLALDDLGAGYAGLTLFAELGFDVVKLDMSLTRGIEQAMTKQKLIESVVALCRELGRSIVVEGVETKGELATLLSLGCDLFQGYLFGRPVPVLADVPWADLET